MIYLFILLSFIVAVIFYRNTLPLISKRRKVILIILRGTFIFFLLLILFNPVLHISRRYVEKDVFVILRDNSNSMFQVINGKNKLEHLTIFFNKTKRALERQGYKVEIVDIFKENPKQSVLFDEYQKKIRDIYLRQGTDTSLKGIALLSDGWFHDDYVVLKQISDIPLYTFNAEISLTDADIQISEIYYNSTARVNEIHSVKIMLSSKNFDGDVNVLLRDSAGKKQYQKKISIDNNVVDYQIDFELLFDEIGLKVFEIEIIIEDSDISAKDFIAIQVLETKNKILIISDTFNWNIRFLNRVVNSDDRYDADLVYQKNRRFYKGNKEYSPDWQTYSGIILINSKELVLNNQETDIIKEKVFNGTGLIGLGNPVKGLEDISPITLSNVSIANDAQTILTSEALTFQLFRDVEQRWQRLAPVNFFYHQRTNQAIPLANIVMQGAQTTGREIPAISLSKYGSGNVLHFSFNNLWQWFLDRDSASMNDFLKNIYHWIFTKEAENFYASTSKNVYYTGESVTVNLFAFDEKLNPLMNLDAKIEIFDDNKNMVFNDFFISGSGNISRNETASISIRDLDAGKYEYRINDSLNNRSTKGSFSIVEHDIESQNRGFNTSLLSEMSNISGGMQFNSRTIESFEHGKAESIKKTKHYEIQIYKNVFFVLSFLFIFCLELFLRKKWSLL